MFIIRFVELIDISKYKAIVTLIYSKIELRKVGLTLVVFELVCFRQAEKMSSSGDYIISQKYPAFVSSSISRQS